MREFTLEDGFTLSAIMDKMDFKIDLNAFVDALSQDKDKAAYLGGQIFLDFIKKMHLAKAEIFQIVSDMTGDSIDEVKKYSVTKIKETLLGIFSQPGVVDFFKQAGASVLSK